MYKHIKTLATAIGHPFGFALLCSSAVAQTCPWQTGSLSEYVYSWFSSRGPYFDTPEEACTYGSSQYFPPLNLALAADCFCRDNGGLGWLYIQPYFVDVVDRYFTPSPAPQACASKVGNPIWPLTGAKTQRVDLGQSLQNMKLEAAYDSTLKIASADGSIVRFTRPTSSINDVWTTNAHRQLTADQYGNAIHLADGSGRWSNYLRSGSSDFKENSNSDARILRVSAIYKGNQIAYRHLNTMEFSVDEYRPDGKIAARLMIDGARIEYEYSTSETIGPFAPNAGLLVGLTDAFGRKIALGYSTASGTPRLRRIVGPNSAATEIDYDVAGNPSLIRYADGGQRQLKYENPSYRWALTGIVDESGGAFANFLYDASGRALTTHHGAGAIADSYRVSYSAPPQRRSVRAAAPVLVNGYPVVYRDHYWDAPSGTQVTGPLATSAWSSSTPVGNFPLLTSRSQAAGAGCSESTGSLSYDANGNVATRNDFNGNRTCFGHDQDRNVEAVRVEGLSAGTSCTEVGQGVALPAGARKISTKWHPDWRLPVKVAEPGRITTFVYNGQPDPLAANSIANCAPVNARLPDGKPIVVLCRQIEQATSDIDGSQGLDPQLQTSTVSREQRWSYNQTGQVLSHDGPLDGSADTTVYAYYAETAFDSQEADAAGHTQGDLQSKTNPAGHVTRFTRYNRAGQILEMIDPNGVVTTYAYDTRQRLTRISINGQATSYDYWPTGLLKRATQADGSYLSYQYDDAHRLVRLSDGVGNSVEYTLDGAGNRVAETVRDSVGNLRAQLNRSIDALGRVQTLMGREVAP